MSLRWLLQSVDPFQRELFPFPSFLNSPLETLYFSSPPPFSQLSTSRRVVLFFFLLFSSRFDYATLRIPFPVINP